MQAPPPPARTGPRPLPLHLAMEAWISQLSFAGLMTSNAVSRPSSLPANPFLQLPLPDLLQKALAESGDPQTQSRADLGLDPVRLIDAITTAAKQRMTGFAAGVARYHGHAVHRDLPDAPIAWQHGAATLRDYGGEGPAVLVVPSLINRSTVLDLAADRSLLRSMAAHGLRTFLLDWGYPGETERAYSVDDYMTRALLPALDEVAARANDRVRIVGYCMGGTLAVAPAMLAPARVAALAAVAAPWDFHADSTALRTLLSFLRPMLDGIITAYGEAPFDLLQALFASLDPTLVGRKFRRFANLDQASDEAARFVVLEDWLNDPVPLTANVARECLFAWYGENAPLRGAWRVAGSVIDPARVKCPSLVLIPSRDRIVPPASAQALAQALPGASVRNIPLGHIGMMAGSRAADVTYAPLIQWLKTTA